MQIGHLSITNLILMRLRPTFADSRRLSWSKWFYVGSSYSTSLWPPAPHCPLCPRGTPEVQRTSRTSSTSPEGTTGAISERTQDRDRTDVTETTLRSVLREMGPRLDSVVGPRSCPSRTLVVHTSVVPHVPPVLPMHTVRQRSVRDYSFLVCKTKFNK